MSGQIAPSNVVNQVPTSSTPANALCERNTLSASNVGQIAPSNVANQVPSSSTPANSNVGQIAPSNVAKQVPTSSTPAINSFGVVAPYVEYSNHVYTQSNDAPENQWSHPSLSFQAISGSNYAAQAPTWEYMAPYLS
ncbi:hypothetical protein J5N97_017804 [Dioscorea zingiberensis]|uniref:Uncharacterized protein n=1 Tax=Dioscorea zingiberensis TaxID=325984 RepID=A0A9D5CMN5_9LILI|nr:hypothetical protein J5N97_017804 [Dioscorea zingiberensis]